MKFKEEEENGGPLRLYGWLLLTIRGWLARAVGTLLLRLSSEGAIQP